MLKIGIIGAGNISKRHIQRYCSNPQCEVVAISDINPERAKAVAKEFEIKNIFTDHKDILNNPDIDAVSIVTPTFTHKNIALDAIKADKHILCEKPPALNADEVREIQNALKGYKKVFMFGLVRRFYNTSQYAKKYVESGKMGKIITAEASRISQIAKKEGWFAKRSLGGGSLRDEAIHELDLILYLMGYPKPTAIMAYESHLNNGLAAKMKSISGSYPTADKTIQENDTEDIIKGFINLNNGANIILKSGSVHLSYKTELYVEITGEKAGILFKAPWGNDKKMHILELTDDYYLNDTTPGIVDNDPFNDEINHFVDCCLNGAECIVKVDEAVTLMEIIDALYHSAETSQPVIF